MARNSAVTDTQPPTRTRLVESAATLFSRHGYAATGVKAVLAAAEAPYGSLYHWFPGGKQQLGVAAVAHGGAHQRAYLQSLYPPGADIAEATTKMFIRAGKVLEATNYADACPVATIALEVASSDEPIRAAAADAFNSWIEIFEQRFTEAGMTPHDAHTTATQVFCLMEGAVLLARTTHTTTPLHTAGDAATELITTRLSH
jgi:AcrR family transcriptional regulator